MGSYPDRDPSRGAIHTPALGESETAVHPRPLLVSIDLNLKEASVWGIRLDGMTKLEKFILWVDDAGKVREMREAGGRIFVEKVRCDYYVVRVCLSMTM
jgi:hypothetical protein